MPILKSDFTPWPEDADNLDLQKMIELYENGFAGAIYSQEAKDEFKASMTWPNGEDVCHIFGLADTGAGKLSLPFLACQQLYPKCWPGAAQEVGDCVSHSQKNANFVTMCVEIITGHVDEKTGKQEEAPIIPEQGIITGALSSEAIYWYRGYNSHGWHCPTAAKVSCNNSGCVIRQAYPDLDLDLTTYSGRKASLYGSRSPTESIQQMTKQHLMYTATNANSAEAVRDLLANGKGITTCGSEGYSNSRDENGVSRRSGSWAHAMAAIAFDDRDVIKAIYNEPLVLIINSWGRWNSGPRDIYQSASLVPAPQKDSWIAKGIVNPSTGNIMIPEGSFWCRWSQCRNRQFIAMSGVNGWPRKDLDKELFKPW